MVGGIYPTDYLSCALSLCLRRMKMVLKQMNNGGLSRARLGRMHDVMAGYVERSEVPGIVTLVGRRGEVHVDAIGMKAVEGLDPMRRDTIFRISSMTKPITAAATMILVEECKLRLDEPVRS